MRTRKPGTVVSAVIATLVLITGSAEHAAARTAAQPDGGWRGVRAIRVGPVRQEHCHDAIPRLLRCFTTRAARDASWRENRSLRPLSTYAGGYVIAWVNASYAGSSVILSQDYTNLVTIGWNDRISSYKVYTNLTGGFYEHSNYSGLTQLFCCFSQVSYVGDAYNDKFTSINLP